MYLGIDVSKGYADFLLMNARREAQEKSFQLDDNAEGHQTLTRYLGWHIAEGRRIICGVESTGGYEQNWLVLLKRLQKHNPVEVYKLNPKGVKHQLESTLRRTITDSVSAEGIAEYLVNNYEQARSKWQKNTFKEGRVTASQRCLNLILGLLKQQTARYNQLEKLLYQNFPELLMFCKQKMPNWLIRLLIKYPGLDSIHRAHVNGIDGVKGISPDKAKKLKDLAAGSVGSQDHELEGIMIKTLVEDIEHHQRRIDQLKDYLVRLYNNRNTELLKSIRGIADWTAAALVLLLDEVQRFDSTDQIAAFYGVHPKVKQSGDGSWKVRMSKQGDSKMRAVLYIAANNVILHEPYFKKLYEHYLGRGKKPKAARGIIMHKLLRVVYGMLKYQTPFDCKVDEQNQKENPRNPESQIAGVNRRYQELTTAAPISRRNYKKRRAALECQISGSDTLTASSSTALLQK